MPVLQQSGRIALAKAVAARAIYIALGRGDPAWDTSPMPEPTGSTALVDEIGRRLVTDIAFVQPDPDGEIELPNQDKYAVVDQPTPWLLLRATFNFEDAQGQTVREAGVFFDPLIAPGVPPGQRWVLAAEVLAPGDLYTLERRAADYRSGSVRAVEEIILPF